MKPGQAYLAIKHVADILVYVFDLTEQAGDIKIQKKLFLNLRKFNKPIIVYTNDNLSFEGIVEKNYNVLLNWFSKDLDRLMLYGYELNIQIK